MKRGQLLCYEVTGRIDGRQVRESVGGGNRKLRCIVQSRIEEPALPVHLEIGDQRVPVGDRSPRTGPRVLVEARQSKCVWYQRGAWHIRSCDDAVRHLSWIERFAVENYFRIEFAGSP